MTATRVGDSAPEARARKMSAEIERRLGRVSGRALDLPRLPRLDRAGAGGAECAAGRRRRRSWSASRKSSKALTLAPLFKFLDDHKHSRTCCSSTRWTTPRHRVREVLAALQAVSSRPLVLRQVPIREASKSAANRHRLCRSGQRARLPLQARRRIGPDRGARGRCSRGSRRPGAACWSRSPISTITCWNSSWKTWCRPRSEIYRQLAKDLAGDLIVPVLIGSAEHDGGVRRLLKALRHEVPEAEETAKRHRHRAGPGDTAALGLQDLSPAPYRQAVAGARAGERRSRTARRSAATGSRRLPRQRPRVWTSSPAQRRARSSASAAWSGADRRRC